MTGAFWNERSFSGATFFFFTLAYEAGYVTMSHDDIVRFICKSNRKVNMQEYWYELVTLAYELFHALLLLHMNFIVTLGEKSGSASPNDGGQHRSERGRVRQLISQAECGGRTWTSLHHRLRDLSPVPALAWPGRALRRTVWALTAQQLVRTPVYTVLRCTAADLAVLAGGKYARI